MLRFHTEPAAKHLGRTVTRARLGTPYGREPRTGTRSLIRSPTAGHPRWGLYVFKALDTQGVQEPQGHGRGLGAGGRGWRA